MSYSGPTPVQSEHNLNNGPSVTIAQAFDSNTTGGNSILVLAGVTNGNALSGSTVSDTQGNTYTLLLLVNDESGSSGIALFRCDGIPAAANTITFRPAFTASGGIIIIETTPLGAMDQSSTGGANSGNSAPYSAGPITPSENNELLVAGFMCFVAFTLTPGGSFTGIGGTGLLASYLELETAASTSATASEAGFDTAGNYFIASFPNPPSGNSISGNAGEAGANVAYTGTASGSVTADGSGNYTIPSLAAGSYTITPSAAGFTFSPTSSPETISGSNITGVDFTATPSGGGSSPTVVCIMQ